ILEGLGGLGEVVRVEGGPAALPPLSGMDPESTGLGFTCWLRSRAPRAEVEACFDVVDDPDAVQVVEEAGEDAGSGGGPPAARAAAPGPDGGGAHPVAAAAGPAGAAGEHGPGAAADHRAGRGAESGPESIRVATEKVDRLVDLVGELVITQSMVAQTVHQLAASGFSPERLSELAEAVAQMDHHARELEERVMAIRMLPIRTVFARFSRVVRDLARARGKQVRFETRGDETELDKTVIERIADPLMHLVRNAVDHGIEPPEERRARGKPETGALVLGAYQQGGSIYIEVQDDGRGLDRDRILRKAIEVGLVAGGEGLSDEEV